MATLSNTVSGDGQTFVAQLKAILQEYEDKLTGILDAAEQMDAQVQNVVVTEIRVDTDVSLKITCDTTLIDNFQCAIIQYKIYEGLAPTDLDWSTIAVSGEYTTGISGTYILNGCKTGYTYHFRIQGENMLGTVSLESDCPTTTHYVSFLDNTPVKPASFEFYFDNLGCHWSWVIPLNTVYSYTELRWDTNVGNSINLAEITQDSKSSISPITRTGTAYIYNKGAGNEYSSAASKDFTIPIPITPTNVSITSTWQGIRIDFDNIPLTCIGATIKINGEEIFTNTNSYTYNCVAGIYTIQIAYKDIIGNGPFSTSISTTLEQDIPSDAIHITNLTVFDDGIIIGKYIGDKEVIGTKIADGAITTDKISANAVTANEIAANTITTGQIVTTGLTSDAIATNAIISDKIAANAVTADKIIAEAVTAGKIAANAVTTDTINAGAITTDKIDSDAITADKIAAGSITGVEIAASTTITSPLLIAATIQNSVSNPTFSIDASGNITGATLSAESIYNSGYKVKDSILVKGFVAHGDIIPLPDGFTDQQCMYTVQYVDVSTQTGHIYNTNEEQYVNQVGWSYGILIGRTVKCQYVDQVYNWDAYKNEYYSVYNVYFYRAYYALIGIK